MKVFLPRAFLLAALVLSTVTAYAAPDADELEGLATADQLAEMDGLRPPPPRPPHPRPPRPPQPRPPYPPQPRPPYPPQPYPPQPYPPYPPAPQPAWRYSCVSQDRFGTTYTGTGEDPRWVQYDVHRYCEYQSNGPCRDLGCRRY